MYANSENSLFVLAKKEEQVIAIVSGLPLSESSEENKKLFEQLKMPMEHVFYLGEMVLSQEYLKDDVKERLYQQFEKAIAELEIYTTLILCEIERSEDTNSDWAEIFWQNRGFVREPELKVYYSWKEVAKLGQIDHTMVFWRKDLAE